MAAEKKIFLDKADGLKKVLAEIADVEAERVVLNIPRDSALAASVHNFQILRKECETTGRELSVESVDERVLELAAIAKIPAKDPVFKRRDRTVTDIIPKAKRMPVQEEPVDDEKYMAMEEEEAPKPKRRKFLKKKERSAPEPAVEPEMEVEREPESEPSPVTAEEEEAIGEPEEDEVARPRVRHRRSARFALTFGALIAILGVGYVIATYALPRVTIDLTLQKTSTDLSENVAVSSATKVPAASGSTITLPGQLLIAQNSLVITFPATGTSTVSSKASGTLIVYNDYSSAPQVLVATTRFVSPGGQLFRSTEKVTIPGAKVTGGTIVPSSASVHVVAAEAGADYNLAAGTGHWTIPGFEGTPRYAKFYAEAPNGLSGGASGVSPVATRADVLAAQAKAVETLQNSLASQIGLSGADQFKFLPDSASFATTSETVTPVNSEGQFNVLISGEMRQMVFDPSMLQNELLVLNGVSASTTKIDALDLNYGSTTLDLAKGLMNFKLTGSLVYEPAVDVTSVKAKIAGVDEANLKSIVFGITGLQKANISFWPFWVSTVPQDQSKIDLNLN